MRRLYFLAPISASYAALLQAIARMFHNLDLAGSTMVKAEFTAHGINH